MSTDYSLPPVQIQKNCTLFTNSARYLILDFNGEGAFGKVAKCLDLTTGEMVAVKIHTSNDEYIIQEEIKMLQVIKKLDPERNNMVRFKESFRCGDMSCLAFEMLDRSLWDLMKERNFTPMTLNEIRPVIYQLLEAFDALKGMGITHTDLKPDNVMLVNHRTQPYKIKLIDFGLAKSVNELEVGTIMQAFSYRAPEVMLGLPLSEAIDMWGIGCVMAFMYFGRHLLPGDCEYRCMKSLVHLLGQPSDHLLKDGMYTSAFFSKDKRSNKSGWRLNTPNEYEAVTRNEPVVAHWVFDMFKNLEDAVLRGKKKNNHIECEDRMEFLSLLKSCLHLDPSKRITPKEALKHPFMKMTNLIEKIDTDSYARDAHQHMEVCPMYYLDDTGNSLISGFDEFDESSINESDIETFYDDDYKGAVTIMSYDDFIRRSSGNINQIHGIHNSEKDKRELSKTQPTGLKTPCPCPPFKQCRKLAETKQTWQTNGLHFITCSSHEDDNQPAIIYTSDDDQGDMHNGNNSICFGKEDNMQATEYYQVKEQNILISKSTCYQVMDFNGEGCFGKVAKCLNLATNEMVAVKIHTDNDENIIQREVQMLQAIRALDPDKKNIVRFMENFRFNNLSCLAFEMLDRSLYDLMNERMGQPLSLNEIRPVIQQLLVAFDALKGIGVVHTDLKPDNIMLVDHKRHPYRVKLIDFGLACSRDQLSVGMAIQARQYRAPEVMLGLPLSEAVDMWGVGCIMAFLYFGQHLFPGNCAYNWMGTMVALLGQPDNHLLRNGKYTSYFFTKLEGFRKPQWRFNSPEEYKMATGFDPQTDAYETLEDIVLRFQNNRDATKCIDTMAFLSLLKSCLHLDPSKRITPKEALEHPFIKMTHLVDESATNACRYAN